MDTKSIISKSTTVNLNFFGFIASKSINWINTGKCILIPAEELSKFNIVDLPIPDGLHLIRGTLDKASDEVKADYYQKLANNPLHTYTPPLMLVVPRKKSESDLKDAVSDILNK